MLRSPRRAMLHEPRFHLHGHPPRGSSGRRRPCLRRRLDRRSGRRRHARPAPGRTHRHRRLQRHRHGLRGRRRPLLRRRPPAGPHPAPPRLRLRHSRPGRRRRALEGARQCVRSGYAFALRTRCVGCNDRRRLRTHGACSSSGADFTSHLPIFTWGSERARAYRSFSSCRRRWWRQPGAAGAGGWPCRCAPGTRRAAAWRKTPCCGRPRREAAVRLRHRGA